MNFNLCFVQLWIEGQIDEIKSTIKKYMDSNSVDIPGSHKLDIRSGNIGEYNGRKVLLDYPYGGSLF